MERETRSYMLWEKRRRKEEKKNSNFFKNEKSKMTKEKRVSPAWQKAQKVEKSSPPALYEKQAWTNYL